MTKWPVDRDPLTLGEAVRVVLGGVLLLAALVAGYVGAVVLATALS